MTEAQSESADERRFAFCADKDGPHRCPAIQAGHDRSETTSGSLGEITFQYDKNAADRVGTDNPGTVPEPVAKESWMDAIDEFDEGSEPYKIGREIADELGWLDDQ